MKLNLNGDNAFVESAGLTYKPNSGPAEHEADVFEVVHALNGEVLGDGVPGDVREEQVRAQGLGVKGCWDGGMAEAGRAED